jgi:hypothetical protein
MNFVFFANFALDIMKKTPTRILCLVMAVLILFANAGTLMVRHVCHSSHGLEVSVFGEYLQQGESSCCCACTPDSCTPVSDTRVHFAEVPCCQEFVSYLKAELESLPTIKPVKLVFAQVPGILPVPAFVEEERSLEASVSIGPEDPSPPPSGRSLVISFHQLKIPAIS